LYLRLEIAAENAAAGETILRRNKCSDRFKALKPRKMLCLREQNQGFPSSLAAQTAPKAVTG
jgi:hypothetical protein